MDNGTRTEWRMVLETSVVDTLVLETILSMVYVSTASSGTEMSTNINASLVASIVE